jgi:hypothetical protein
MIISIKKIKFGKGKIAFEYDKKEDENSFVSMHTSKFEEEPEPEFWRVFGLLSVDVCRILEVDPGQLAGRFLPTGVSYSTDAAGYDGAIITCEYRMPRSKATTTINTPLFKFPQLDSEKGLSGYFGEETVKHLRDLQEEAILYLEGQRGQGSLFDDEGGEPRNVTAEHSHVRLIGSGDDIQRLVG